MFLLAEISILRSSYKFSPSLLFPRLFRVRIPDSSKLRQADTIRRIVVWEQGRGAINNLGALRIKPFSEWGLYDEETHQVYQWDGATLSPVAHQWDRDKHLHGYMTRQAFKDYEQEWEERKKKLKK